MTTARPSHDQLIRPALAGLSAAVLVAGIVYLFVGDAVGYAGIFPPIWLSFVAVAAVATSLLQNRLSLTPSSARAVAWFAVVLLFGASGGFLLDLFRAFFNVTGIPAGDFAEVDWPGAVLRGLSGLTAVVAVVYAWGLRPRRVGKESTRHRGVVRNRLAVFGIVLCVPYPVLKLVWWFRDDADLPTMEVLAFGAAGLLVILLTRPVGRFLPRWLLLTGGWCASIALLSMGALMVFGVAAQATGTATVVMDFGDLGTTVMVSMVYGTWLLLGLVILASTLEFWSGRRLPDTEPVPKGAV